MTIQAIEWIPTKDRLPDARKVVLVEGGVAYLDLEDVWISLTGYDFPGKPISWEVTHWASLPEIPTNTPIGRCG